MDYQLDYEFLKNILFPAADLLLKFIIGIFLAMYLFRRGKKDKIKELIIELYQKIGEELNVLRQVRYENNLQHIVNMASPEPVEIRLIDSMNISNKTGDIIVREDFYILIDSTGQESLNKIDRHLSRLDLLLGEKEYNNNVKGLKSDLLMYLADTKTVIDIESELFENVRKSVNEHYKAYKDNLITKGEYSNHVFMEAYPLFQEANKKLQNRWEKLIYPHLTSLRKAIHKMG